jgi:hypothetical protein
MEMRIPFETLVHRVSSNEPASAPKRIQSVLDSFAAS